MRQHLRQPSSTPPATPATSDSGSSQPAAFHSLFAYPLESNFSGVCYGLQPIMQAQQHGVKVHGEARKPSRRKEQWHVFLDAAKACGSKPPDLQQAPADFVVSIASWRFNLQLQCAVLSCTTAVYHPVMMLEAYLLWARISALLHR